MTIVGAPYHPGPVDDTATVAWAIAQLYPPELTYRGDDWTTWDAAEHDAMAVFYCLEHGIELVVVDDDAAEQLPHAEHAVTQLGDHEQRALIPDDVFVEPTVAGMPLRRDEGPDEWGAPWPS